MVIFKPAFNLSSTTKRILIAGLLFIFLARFGLVGEHRILLAANSADGDQNSYLQLGLDLREHGILTDGTRNPLYPAFLALFARREWAYFTWGKLLSLGFGLLTIVATYWVGARLFNRWTGLLGAFLLSINMEFTLHSTFVMVESLLSLLMLLSWFAMLKALQNPHRLRMWVAAGVLAGLAYLAKSTALLLIFCFGLTALLLYGYRIVLKRTIWAFAASFAVVSLPLWLYNWVAFGSPVYNFAIKNAMWMDSWEDSYTAGADELPTLLTFLQSNNPAKMWDRLWTGLLAMRFFFAKLLWPTRTVALDHFLLAGGLDIMLVAALAAILLSWRRLKPVVQRNRVSLLLTGTTVGLFYVLFGWYLPIVALPIRFLIPLTPVLFLLASAGAVGLAQAAAAHPKTPRWVKAGGSVVLLLAAVWVGVWFVETGISNAQAAQANLFESDAEFNQYNEQALRWVAEGHTPADPVTVLWGPSHNLPIWRLANRLHFVRTPAKADSYAQLEPFTETQQVTYIIVDDDMTRRRRDLVASLGLSRSSGELLAVGDFPADWALGLTAPAHPCRWCVFRRLSGPPPITPADYSLAGDAIRLFGYEMDTRNFSPGGEVTVLLYWESVQPVPTDYTIFTQLLGPDFQLHGQMDRQPLSGHFPTTRWQPGQKFLDKFVIPVDPTAPPGDYVLLVGLYDLDTGQRAPVTANGEPLPDNAIPLLTLSLR
ncbi:MAG: phospholipid carrier-dependent glycosyltransferase [Caldilineae bacterium]|nr:MAG: phospholipid carrier-dependent glycosyltransferase [Caldilineae bacterium]